MCLVLFIRDPLSCRPEEEPLSFFLSLSFVDALRVSKRTSASTFTCDTVIGEKVSGARRTSSRKARDDFGKCIFHSYVGSRTFARAASTPERNSDPSSFGLNGEFKVSETRGNGGRNETLRRASFCTVSFSFSRKRSRYRDPRFPPEFEAYPDPINVIVGGAIKRPEDKTRGKRLIVCDPNNRGCYR